MREDLKTRRRLEETLGSGQRGCQTSQLCGGRTVSRKLPALMDGKTESEQEVSAGTQSHLEDRRPDRDLSGPEAALPGSTSYP